MNIWNRKEEAPGQLTLLWGKTGWLKGWEAENQGREKRKDRKEVRKIWRISSGREAEQEREKAFAV